MTDQNRCPVCRTEPVPMGPLASYSDVLFVDCPHCGPFSISGAAAAVLRSVLEKDGRKAALISYMLRRMQRTEERPLLKSGDITQIVETAKLPLPSEQSDNLVRWLGDNSDFGVSKRVGYSSHGAIIGTTSEKGLRLLLKGLEADGLITWSVSGAHRPAVQLTTKGWAQYEQLHAIGGIPTPEPSEEQLRHRYAAILATDMVGYTKRMGTDEKATLAARSPYIEVVKKAAQSNGGRMFKTAGDGTFSEFGSAIAAARAALEIQREVARQNTGVELHMGLAVGDVVPEGDDLLGAPVNLAARLQGLATPGTLCTLEHIRDDLANKNLELHSEDIGPKELKGIERPVRLVLITLK